MIATWLKEYRKDWLRFDVIAGLTAAAVVVPKAMAYATIAGLPVQVGLYTALVPMVIYALLGTSRVLSVSTTTTIAILTGAELRSLAPDGNAATLLTIVATLSVLVGVFLVAASLLRLGFIADFISEPVLIGFKAGIGLVIVLDQIPKLLGVHITKGTFLQNVVSTAQAVPHTVLAAFAVGALTIVVLVALEEWVPKVPAPLVAVVGGILAVSLLGLTAHGVEVVGEVPRGLPAPILPDLSLLGRLWPGALGIALMSFTETAAAARAFAVSSDPPLRANVELFATGLANAGSGLLGGMPAGGGTSQTAVNRQAGAKSQMAELVTAGAALLIMLFLAGPMGRLPQATLAAVVIVYSVGLISLDGFRSVLKVRRLEFYWALAATAGVVLLGTLKGIVVAILISLASLAQQAANPPVYQVARKRGTNVFRRVDEEHPDDERFPGLLMVRVEGRVFFANAPRIGERLRQLAAENDAKVIAVHMGGVFDLEYTALKALTEGEERLRAEGVSIWLTNLTPAVLEMVQRSGLADKLGPERMHFNLESAVAAYQNRRTV
jgi:high affinity sulfate transporter 1